MRFILVLCVLAAAAFASLGSASALTLPDHPASAPPDFGRSLRAPPGADLRGAHSAARSFGPGADTPQPSAADALPPSAERMAAPSEAGTTGPSSAAGGPSDKAVTGGAADNAAAAAQTAAFALARRALPGAAEAARTAARASLPAPHFSLFHARPAPLAAPAPIPAALRLGRMGPTELAAAGLFGGLLLTSAIGLVVLPAPGARARPVRHRSGSLVRGVARLARRVRRAVPGRARRGRRTSYQRFRKALRPAMRRPRCETGALARPRPATTGRMGPVGAPAEVSADRVRVRRIAWRRRGASGAA